MKDKLSSKERVLRALNHKEPDRIPLDLGGTEDSSIVREAYEDLKEYLDLSPANTKFLSYMLRSVKVEKEVLDEFEIDTRGIFPGQHRSVTFLDNNKYIDEWGVIREKRENIPYFEQIEAPLDGNITKNDIRNYDWPDPDDPGITEGLQKQVQNVRNEGDYAMVLSLPSPFIHKSQYIRGFEDWYLDCAANKDMIKYLFDYILDITIQKARNILDVVGEDIHIAALGDDLGTQENLQVSPEFFREIIKPRFEKYIKNVKSLTSGNAKVFFHTCGSVTAIIKDLIEIGVDVLNPVQVSAKNMDPQKLKREYGQNICFWGGVDTQSILCRGEVADVKDEVEKMIEVLGKDGGYVLGAVHNIQPDVPPENIVAMYKHALNFSSFYYDS